MAEPISVPLVATEIVAGDALTMAQVAALRPSYRGEGSGSSSTAWRWVVHGSKDASGNIVKLEAAKLGNQWLTSRAALARFAARLSATSPVATSADSPQADEKPRTPAARAKASAAATKRLESAGA